MFGKPRRSFSKEFNDLDLLEFDPTPPSPDELLTRAPLISPMQSPKLPTEVTAFKLGGHPTGPSLVRSMAAGYPVYYIPNEDNLDDIGLLGKLSDDDAEISSGWSDFEL